jgi:hypothetical protein
MAAGANWPIIPSRLMEWTVVMIRANKPLVCSHSSVGRRAATAVPSRLSQVFSAKREPDKSLAERLTFGENRLALMRVALSLTIYTRAIWAIMPTHVVSTLI